MTPVTLNARWTAVVPVETGLLSTSPKLGGQLGLIVEVSLGTSARNCEALALPLKGIGMTTAAN